MASSPEARVMVPPSMVTSLSEWMASSAESIAKFPPVTATMTPALSALALSEVSLVPVAAVVVAAAAVAAAAVSAAAPAAAAVDGDVAAFGVFVVVGLDAVIAGGEVEGPRLDADGISAADGVADRVHG